MKKTPVLLALLFLLTLRIGAQTCNYVAYDGFTYAAGTPIQGLQGGTGWSAAWNVQGDNATVPGFEIANADPMTFSDLQTSGNYASGGYQYLSAGRLFNLNAGGPFDTWRNGNGAIGEPGTTLWASVMLRKTENNNEEVAVYWHPHNIPWCWGCSTERLGIGYFGEAPNGMGQRFWSLYLNGSVYPTSIPIVTGQTAFLVVKMEFGAPTSTISLFVNPATLGNAGPPAMADLVQTTNTAFNIRAAAFYVENNPATGHLDEFRMAATYPCAAPDATVTVNQPPNAAFSTTPSSGMAPLVVALNGSASVDPEGGPLTYAWNFGDGTSGTGQSVNHTYTATGILPVTLTVSDQEGLSHSFTQNITVLNQYGTFTCELGLTCEKMATCNQSDGRFRVTNYQNIPLTLKNGAGVTVSPAPGNNNLYENLPIGQYTLTAAGSNGCRDTFQLHIVTDSATCTGWSPEACNMKIGVGIEGLAYWTPSRPFKDYFKSSGEWITYDPNPPGGNFIWDTQNNQYIPYDANGYPMQVPFNVPNGSGQNNVRGIFSASGHVPAGIPLRLLYDGTGTIQMQGGLTVTNNAPGQIDFTINDDGNIFFNLTASQSGDHVRNIRIVAVSDLATYQTQPFRQGFLDKCEPFHTLRFMDWMGTNGSEQTAWASRTQPGWYSQAATPNGGLAYEYIIQLANHLDKDIWICVPHQADNDYIEQMATLFRDQLDPGINVYLEYSNEVWNWIFAQAHWVDQNGPSNISYPRKYVERAQHAFQIWHNVWGAQKTRVRRVLGTQNGYNWITEEILAHADPDLYDYISPSWYFGLDHSASGVPNLQALGASATAEDVLENSRNTWMAFLPYWHMVYRTAKLYNKKIVNYEGGQHFTDFSVPAYIQAMYDAQVHPEMYNLYDDALDTLRRMGSEMPLAFVLCGPWESVYGSWGHIFDEDDPAPWVDRPKYQVLMDQIDQCITTPMPVELSSFIALCRPEGLVVEWQAAASPDLLAFRLQRSYDGANWAELGQFERRADGAYRVVLADEEGGYYRLATHASDGTVDFSSVIRADCPNGSEIVIAPNPTTGLFEITLPDQWQGEPFVVQVCDLAGRPVERQAITSNRQLRMGQQLPAGVYSVTVYNVYGHAVRVVRLIKM